MRQPTRSVVPCSALVILLSGLVIQAQASDDRVSPVRSACNNAPHSPGPPSAACVVERRVTTLRGVREVLRRQASAPLPPGLSVAEADEARRYVAWLNMWADRLEALATQGDHSLGKGRRPGKDPIESAAGSGNSQAQRFQTTKQMQEQQLSFNRRYLEVPTQMENEHRQFYLVSNVMKTKHDTVKNSISSISTVR